MKRLPTTPWRIRAAAAASHAWPALAAADIGQGGHDEYFSGLQAALKSAGIAEPTLVIDLQRYRANIEVVRSVLSSTGLALRLVSKSLQAPALIEEAMRGTGSDRLMVFNGVMLEEIAATYPRADVLLGRPLPAAQVAAFVAAHARDGAPASRPQWLVDSERRLAQYGEVGRVLGARMRISLEIDVGLHRGGVRDEGALARLIDAALADPTFEIAGLMGYDAHAVGFSDPGAEIARVEGRYARAKSILAKRLQRDVETLTLNTAGSPTYALHGRGSAANEVSVGSALVKPTHFDMPSLARHIPAAFIAQPVLKAVEPALVPKLEAQASDLKRLDPNCARGFFLYGGYGDARVVSPRGLRFSTLYGVRSMLTGSEKVTLSEDDFVFMRPTESEGVFLQFGDLAVFDGRNVVARWPTFKVAA